MLGEAARYSLRHKAVWIKFISEKDLEAFLDKAVLERDSSPFFCAIEVDGVYGFSPFPGGAKNSRSTPSCLGCRNLQAHRQLLGLDSGGRLSNS